MLFRRFYYTVKPFVPWGVRMAVRRTVAMRARRRHADKWPILHGSERPPTGWPGWPEGKKFAFVLTHDVEGRAGLEKVRALMELELQLGFRSAFYFIPEGEYRVPPELREELVRNGFEVGVHDLYHDGKLFNSRKRFTEHAVKINRYLHDWGAVGFRAGFMLNQLGWLHELDIQYDASTFDTDPFEPQPEGVGTIFPFWVGNHFGADAGGFQGNRNTNSADLSGSPNSSSTDSASRFRPGYIEFPYTLPQDLALFLLFREQTIDIWRRKLDWIAQHGGLALVDVHPDYICFGGGPFRRKTYPAKLYVELLEYVRKRYEGRFWHGLPRELAAHLRPAQTRDVKTVPPVLSVASNKKPKIWIDLDNTPHVPFFEPVIEELRRRGYPVFVTARDAFQVCALAEKKGLGFVQVGRHCGKNMFLKGVGLACRAVQLVPYALREKPAIAVSHGARSQLLAANWLRIPTVLLEDYEHCVFPVGMHATWVLAPHVIPDLALKTVARQIRKYPGIKEEVYAWKLKPDPSLLHRLGLNGSDIIVTVRPPATEAHYHNPEAELLFVRFMERACLRPNVRVVLLPRNKKQADLIMREYPRWFENNRTVIPGEAVDGMNLIWHSDLVVSGGGTMNREAAALGVPVYSIFRGQLGAVDRYLAQTGRLVIVNSADEVEQKIRLEKKPRTSLPESMGRETFEFIVNTIIELAETAKTR